VYAIVNVLGLGGVLTMLVAYFLLQQGKLTAHQPLYLWMNFLGGIAVILSLFWDWNLPAFMMEVAWVLISAYGLVRYRERRV
jgi:hypothetical protein